MSANVGVDSNQDFGREPTPDATVAATVTSRARPFFWSLRREIWENRWIYIVPLAVAAIIFVSALINVLRIPEGAVPFHRLSDLSPEYLRLASISLYSMVAAILAVNAGIVGWFYCLDALQSERRDRSVLFWKSLPVSDTTTVLSKVLIGIGVVPLIAFIVAVALYLLLMLVASIVFVANGVSASLLIANSNLFELILTNIYLAVAAILWSAPLYAWAIFVGSWARRATFLWALLPPAAIALAEGLIFGTQHFMTIVGQRISGGVRYAFIESAQPFDRDEFRFLPDSFPDSIFSLLDPSRLLSQSGLWIGLIVAAAFIAAAILMRRYREPL